MRFFQVGVPLIVVAFLALILLGLALWWRKRETQIEKERNLEKEKDWTGICQFDNPQTGAKCQREEFHLEGHYRYIQGRMIQW